MNEAALLHNSLLVGAALFSIGLVGFLCRRNMIVMFLSAEMMLQGVSVSLVAWGRWHNNWDGQVLVIFILDRGRLRSRIGLGAGADAVSAPRRFGYRRLGRICAKAICRATSITNCPRLRSPSTIGRISPPRGRNRSRMKRKLRIGAMCEKQS